jgi:hypothetical protein
MDARLFARTRPSATDVCEHCGDGVDRVWLVPGDVLNSCSACFRRATGRAPVHGQGFSTAPRPRPAGRVASFYLRADGRRPA